MRTTSIATTLLLLMPTACATSQSRASHGTCAYHSADSAKSPEARYREALRLKLTGDAQGYHDTLLELAVDAPQSRAGRRARSTLRGVDALGTLMMFNALTQTFGPASRGLVTGLGGEEDENDALEHLLRDVEKPPKKDQALVDGSSDPPMPTARKHPRR